VVLLPMLVAGSAGTVVVGGAVKFSALQPGRSLTSR
jgi:hypothetical protein